MYIISIVNCLIRQFFMTKEAIGYLTPEQQQSIEGWAGDILPLVEKYPKLKTVNLVIEGGVGTGVTMAHISRRLFPEALYVGTDIAERLMIGNTRQSRAIDEGILSTVQAVNNHPSLGMQGATIHGNCLDAELIRDIMRKKGRQVPLLASYNALNALLDRKMNPWDRKDERDMTTIDDFVSLHTPYISQLHIGADWDDEGATSLSFSYYHLEEAAKRLGWITERFDVGLLIIRPSE